MTYGQLAANAAPLASVISALGSSASATSAVSYVSQVLGPVAKAAFGGSTPLLPAALAVRLADGRVFAFARGVESYLQAASFMAGANALPALLTSSRGNNAVDLYAVKVGGLLASLGAQAGDALTLAGHSFGGAAVLAVAQAWLSGGGSRLAAVHTFGSPKPGLPSRFSLLSTQPVYRWITLYDLVPALPPDAGFFPLAAAIVGPVLAAAWALQGQVGPGLFLPGYGVVQLGNGSPNTLGQGISDLAAVILSGDSDPISPHYVISYQIALEKLASTPAVNASPAAPGTPGAGPPADPPVDGQGAPLAVGTTIQGHTGVPMGPTIPPAFDVLVVPQGTGRPTQVVFAGNYLIASTATFNEATRLAKYMRKVIQRLTLAQSVSPTGLAAGLAATLAAMLNPAGGFNPVPATDATTNVQM
jgi:hypothetical protein